MQAALKSNYEAFAVEAEAFCGLLEGLDPAQGEDLWRVREALAALYAMGMALPPLAGATFRVFTTEELKLRSRELSGRWRRELPVDEFRVVLNPLSKTEEPVTGSLADSLADIWHDLRPGLVVLQNEEGSDESLHREVWWQWKFGFDSHWGKHALEALYALHWLALEDT